MRVYTIISTQRKRNDSPATGMMTRSLAPSLSHPVKWRLTWSRQASEEEIEPLDSSVLPLKSSEYQEMILGRITVRFPTKTFSSVQNKLCMYHTEEPHRQLSSSSIGDGGSGKCTILHNIAQYCTIRYDHLAAQPKT